MSLPFGLVEGDKFVILALTNCGSTVVAADVLADGTAVAAGIPAEMVDEFWQTSLGSIAAEVLRRCNLVLVRKQASANPGLLDSEHEDLGMRVVEVFWLLQLSGVPYYEGAAVLKASVVAGRMNVPAHDDMNAHQFLPSNGGPITKVTLARLNLAAQQATTWRGLLALPQEYPRFKRGLNVLLEGLQERFGQERLHSFVRALEALIQPAIGKTKRQFVDRCQTVATASVASATILCECFDMHSVVEHMNDPDACLSKYPTEQREAIALRRVRQIEAVARFTYAKLLANCRLMQYLKSDSELSRFWKLPSAERKALWGANSIRIPYNEAAQQRARLCENSASEKAFAFRCPPTRFPQARSAAVFPENRVFRVFTQSGAGAVGASGIVSAAAQRRACAPGMGACLEVRVLRRPGRRDPSEAQGIDREVGAEGSVERIRGLTHRNRIGGVHGRASGHVTVKLLRPRPVSVNPAVVRRRSASLPGEVSPYA